VFDLLTIIKILDRGFSLNILFNKVLGLKEFAKNWIEEGSMKKNCLVLGILGFVVLSIAVPAYSWQGRMGGMGDPYGLVEDESDFLIHPAGIANGKGINIYGNYRLSWEDVTDWKHKRIDILTGNTLRNPMSASGDEWNHDALMGAAFPFGPGRMGIFFQYSTKNGDFDGNEPSSVGLFKFGFKNELDDIVLRLLYGLPIGGFKLGGEIKLAYRQEENKTSIFSNAVSIDNITFGRPFDQTNTLPYMLPFDSKYWQASFKGSLEGSIGPAKFSFTTHGGFIFSGENENHYLNIILPATILQDKDYKGDVNGYEVGADFWFRVPLSKDLSSPLLIKFDYMEKKRDGFAVGAPWGVITNDPSFYRNKELFFNFEVGGGIDKSLGKEARVAAGLYYNFLRNKKTWGYDIFSPSLYYADYPDYPIAKEHQIVLKLSGEKEISPMFILRMGLDAFYGWLSEDFNYRENSPILLKLPLNGNHFGIGAWLGSTVKFNQLSIEPFVGGGYQRFNVDGDAIWPANTSILEMELSKKTWSIGGGFSIKFN
jgi:hypothetical protein